MLKVIGIQTKVGEYQGHKYDNIVLHCVCTDEVDTLKGDTTKIVKIKRANLDRVFLGKIKTDEQLTSLIGKQIYPLYDDYKNCIRCDVL